MAKKKKIASIVKLHVKAQEAKPTPPVGPALGQRGANIMEFCKQFNATTASTEKGTPIPVKISIYEDKSFTFTLTSPPTSYLIKKAINLQSGSSEPGKKLVGKISQEALLLIAKVKLPELKCSLKQAVKIIAGTAMSMGIEVEN